MARRIHNASPLMMDHAVVLTPSLPPHPLERTYIHAQRDVNSYSARKQHNFLLPFQVPIDHHLRRHLTANLLARPEVVAVAAAAGCRQAIGPVRHCRQAAAAITPCRRHLSVRALPIGRHLCVIFLIKWLPTSDTRPPSMSNRDLPRSTLSAVHPGAISSW